MDEPFVGYPNGAGFPSGLIPELAGAAWATHYVDNASIYTSNAMLERIRRRVGCAVNLGPVGDWTRRYIIEGVHSVLERRGFQRLPNTTGAGPRDPRRRNAEEAAVQMRCDWKELLYLIDVAIASYNATRLPALGNRSPLQALQDLMTHPCSHFIPRLLPPLQPGTPDLGVVVERRVVRGNVKEGRCAHITVDEVDYTSPTLAHCGGLIGQAVWVHIVQEDMRAVTAFLPGNEPLGVLTAASGWDVTPHDRDTRRLINKAQRDHKLVRRPDEDWVHSYLRRKTEIAAREAAKHRKPKVSPKATEVAALARKAKLPIPVVAPS